MDRCDRFVVGAWQALVSNRVRIETGAFEDLGSFGREILVDLELHAVSSGEGKVSAAGCAFADSNQTSGLA